MFKLLFLLVFSASLSAHAQAYPTKTIRFILPFSPGGGTDVVARTLGQKITENLGQQVVIDNRGGVGGTVSPAVFKNLPFDPINDLLPVGFAGTSNYVLSFDVWFGVFVPKKTPARIIDILNGQIVKTMNDPAVIANLSAQGMEASSSTPGELAQRIRQETVKWARLVKDAGIKAE